MMGCQRSKFNKNICRNKEEDWLKEVGLMRIEECNQCKGGNAETFKDNSNLYNIGLVNLKEDTETTTSYSGWASSIHWTDGLELLLIVIVIMVAIKKLVTWMRKKKLQKKMTKMEDLKKVLSQQQPQTLPQPQPQNQTLPMSQCSFPLPTNKDRIATAPTTQIIRYNKVLYN